MWSLSRPKKALALTAAAGCLLVLPSTSSAVEGPVPGLPLVPQSDLGSGLDQMSRNLYAWSGVAQVGRAGSVPSKQWLRIPAEALATSIDLKTTDYTDETGDNTRADYDIVAFLVPPSGGGTYGESPTVTVRTVAFGSIPTEITLRINQRRDSDDLPIGFHLRPSFTTNFTRGIDTFPSTALDDRVEVVVKSVRVDAVDIPLNRTCSTGPTAHLSVASKPIQVALTDSFDQAVGFSGVVGGTLEGTLDIPPFSGCTTSTGDDLSPLLTSAASAPDNPVTVTIGILGCYAEFTDEGFPLPPKPGTTVTEAGCQPDQSETVKGIPDPLPFPNHAPGDQPAG